MVNGKAVLPTADTIKEILKIVLKDMDNLGLAQPALHVSLAIASLEEITSRSSPSE